MNNLTAISHTNDNEEKEYVIWLLTLKEVKRKKI